MKAKVNTKMTLTPAQRKRIFGYGKELGLSIEDLREMAAQWTGQKSIRSLSRRQADELILRLQETAGKQKSTAYQTQVPGMISPAQLEKIKKLYPQLGWDKWQFRKWLKKYFHVDNEAWMSATRASKVIEGLKAMIKRKTNENSQ